MFFFVANWSKIELLQSLIRFICMFFVVTWIFRVIYGLDSLISCFNLKISVTWELDQSVAILIIYYYENLLVTEATQFNCFFKESSFPFAESYVSLHFIVDQFKFVYFLFPHLSLLRCLMVWITRFDFYLRILFAFYELFPFYYSIGD
jgi:hypothetical protein